MRQRVLEGVSKEHYGVVTLPTMGTGALDKAQLRAKGVHSSYAIGSLTDVENGQLGFGAHSDQERLLEAELHRFVKMHWDAVVGLAGSSPVGK